MLENNPDKYLTDIETKLAPPNTHKLGYVEDVTIGSTLTATVSVTLGHSKCNTLTQEQPEIA